MDRRDEQASSENVLSLCARVLAEENLRAFRTTDTSAGCRPASLDRRVRKLIRREYRRREHPSFYKYAGKIAAVLAIVCTVSLGAVLSVEAVRSGLWSSVVEFFDDHMSVIFVSETVPPETIDVIKEPVVEQEGWTKEVLAKTDYVYSILYRFPDGKRAISYDQMVLNGTTWNLDNEDGVVQEILLGDYTATLIYREKQQAYILNWSDGEYGYNLNTFSARVTLDELLTIAGSVITK